MWLDKCQVLLTLPAPRLTLYVTFKAYIYVEFCEGGIYMESGLDKQPFCLEYIQVAYFLFIP